MIKTLYPLTDNVEFVAHKENENIFQKEKGQVLYFLFALQNNYKNHVQRLLFVIKISR